MSAHLGGIAQVKNDQVIAFAYDRRCAMPMEYLIVKFPEDRGVRIDDKPWGTCNSTMELEAGTYTISLEPPEDFAPESQDVTLKDTTPIIPFEVIFTKKAESESPPPSEPS